MGILWRINLLV